MDSYESHLRLFKVSKKLRRRSVDFSMFISYISELNYIPAWEAYALPSCTMSLPIVAGH